MHWGNFTIKIDYFGGILILKYLLTIISTTLLSVHLIILYYWLFDWEKLLIPTGLISWLGSILIGITVYLTFRKFVRPEKKIRVFKRIVLVSTILTIVLAIFALIIEMINSSMS